MPSTFNAPVLQVDANIVKLVDTSNPQNLFNLWSSMSLPTAPTAFAHQSLTLSAVMSRCADSLPQGRRLENLIWRLLMEEVPNENKKDSTSIASSSTSLPRDIQLPARKISTEDVPQLSGSVDSFADEEAVEFSSDSSPVDITRPIIRRQNSSASCSSRRERHISSDNLEKMVASIVEQKDSISTPLPEIPVTMSPPKSRQQALSAVPYMRSGSTTTEESTSKESEGHSEGSQVASSLETPITKTTTVVRGFSPAQHPHPTVFTPKLTSNDIPEPKSSPAAKQVQPKKKPTFTLGASSEDSYSDDNHSVEVRQTLAPPAPVPTAPKKKMFQIGGSSEEDNSLKSALASPRNPNLTTQKKATSFANHLTTTIPSVTSSAIMEDDEVSYDESAIESDDDDEWEDSNEDSGSNSVDEKTFFKRVDSTANLPSRRSLISLALENNMAGPNLGGVASQSTSAIPHRGSNRPPFNGPSLVASPNDSDDAPLTMKRQSRGAPMRSINEIPRSTAQPRPIMTAAPNGISQQPMALSPRTTRRNMLATELTESLRRDLLHERSQLKRRHTSTNIVNMAQQARQPQPIQPYMNRGNGDVNASSWDQDFSRDAFAGYHSKGW